MVRLEFSSGAPVELSTARQAELDWDSGHVTVADVLGLLPAISGRVYSVLVDGDFAGAPFTQRVSKDSHVVLVGTIAAPPVELAAYPVEYVYGSEVFQPDIPASARDSQSDAVQQLLDAFRQTRKPTSPLTVGGADPSEVVATARNPVPLSMVSRFLRSIAMDQGKALEATMAEVEKRIERRQKRRLERAAPPPPKPESKPMYTPTAEDFDEARGLLEALSVEGVQLLAAAGFPPQAAQRALLENRLDADAAVNMLLSADLAALDHALTNDEVVRFKEYLGPELGQRVAPEAPSAGGEAMLPTARAAANDDESEDPDATPVDPEVQKIVVLGFSEEQAALALKEFRGSVDLAANALLEGRTFNKPKPPPDGAIPWPKRLSNRLLQLELEASEIASHGGTPAPFVTPALVVQVAQKLLAGDDIDTIRRQEPAHRVLLELSKLFPEKPPIANTSNKDRSSSSLSDVATELRNIAMELRGGLPASGSPDAAGDGEDDDEDDEDVDEDVDDGMYGDADENPQE